MYLLSILQRLRTEGRNKQKKSRSKGEKETVREVTGTILSTEKAS
jgi:hypothetical protein